VSFRIYGSDRFGCSGTSDGDGAESATSSTLSCSKSSVFLQRGCPESLGDRVIQTVELALQCRSPHLPTGSFSILGVEGTDELRYRIGLHEPGAEELQHGLLAVGTAKRSPLAAGSRFPSGGAGHAVLPYRRETAAAAPTAQQAEGGGAKPTCSLSAG
jgi:hypothetical protein